MAKRRAREEASGKPRLLVRFDSDVYEKMQKLASASGVSINQMVNGVMRWATENGHAGEGTFDEEGKITLKKRPGCVFFGRPTVEYSDEEREFWKEERGTDPGVVKYKAKRFFSLDFTVRGLIGD